MIGSLIDALKKTLSSGEASPAPPWLHEAVGEGIIDDGLSKGVSDADIMSGIRESEGVTNVDIKLSNEPYDNALPHELNVLIRAAPTIADDPAAFTEYIRSYSGENIDDFADGLIGHFQGFADKYNDGETLLGEHYTRHVLSDILHHAHDSFFDNEQPIDVNVDHITSNTILENPDSDFESILDTPDFSTYKGVLQFDAVENISPIFHSNFIRSSLANYTTRLFGGIATPNRMTFALSRHLRRADIRKAESYASFGQPFKAAIKDLEATYSESEGFSSADIEKSMNDDFVKVANGEGTSDIPHERIVVLNHMKKLLYDVNYKLEQDYIASVKKSETVLRGILPQGQASQLLSGRFQKDYIRIKYLPSRIFAVMEERNWSRDDIARFIFDRIDPEETLKFRKEMGKESKGLISFDVVKKTVDKILFGTKGKRGNKFVNDILSQNDREFIYKSRRADFELATLFGGYATPLDVMQHTIEHQIHQISKLSVGYLDGIPVSRFSKILENEFEGKQQDVGAADFGKVFSPKTLKKLRIQVGSSITWNLLRNLENYIFRPSYNFTIPIKNPFLDFVNAAVSLSSLSGLTLTILSEDSMGYAMAASKNMREVLPKFIEYFKVLLGSEPNLNLKMPIISEYSRAITNDFRGSFTDASYNILQKFTGSHYMTEQAHQALYSNLAYSIAEDVLAGTPSAIWKRLLGVNDEHFKFLLKENPIAYMPSGQAYLDFVKLQTSTLGSEILDSMIDYIFNSIPVRSTMANAITYGLTSNTIPFGILLHNFYRFKGIGVEQIMSNIVDPLFSGRHGTFTHNMIMGFMQSFMYHIIHDINHGKLPDNWEKYLIKSLVESSSFSFIGDMMYHLMGGDTSSVLGYGALGAYAPFVKVLQSTKYAIKGDFGKSANSLLSGANMFNPIRNAPAIGLLWDRLFLNSMREMLYPGVQNYYNAMKHYANEEGMRYVVPLGKSEVKNGG